MGKSKEIRWFTRHENETITKWFARQGLSFSSVPARKDYYLVALKNDDVFPKLREDRIEIKHRIGASQIYHLTTHAMGYFEEFVKWSFRLHQNDELAASIKRSDAFAGEWLEVRKARMGVKLTRDSNHTMKVHDIREIMDSGCQVEYTRITVKGQVWYSFNLEWFGNEFLELEPAFFDELLGSSVLRLEDSLGYGAFLHRETNEKH